MSRVETAEHMNNKNPSRRKCGLLSTRQTVKFKQS